MPLPIAHGLVGASIIALVHPNADFKNWKPLLLGFILANCPDLDFGFSFLISRYDFHRGFTHSLLFAFLVAGLIFIWLRRCNWQIPLAYSAAFLSHAILDYSSAKNGGVRLLVPFDNTPYRLGLISFSELSNGFDLHDIFYYSLIETVIFAPLFLAAIFVTQKPQNIN
jgi:membrane-bound metal-dependent hydrolase YbcI (DUF457 family)